jgi:hypothetical protein
MDPESPGPRQRRRIQLAEMYDAAIAELRSLHDPGVANLIERLEQHRRSIDSLSEAEKTVGVDSHFHRS